VRLRAKLHKAMKMLENRPVVVRDSGLSPEMVRVADTFPDSG